MGYRTLKACVDDLAATGQLVRIDEEVDPYLEAAAIQRRVYEAGGPAIYFANLTGTTFPAVSNLFGTIERARFLFRDRLETVHRLMELRIDPTRAMRRPWAYAGAGWSATSMLPKRVRRGAVLEQETTVGALPQITSWPDDGGPFVTLPAVYTEDAARPGMQHSNLGMYRIQMAGNSYRQDAEVGLHYQIHRGIGVHHTTAKSQGEPFRVNVFVGGPPSLIFSAVMPLPEGMSELGFAGLLEGRRLRMASPGEGMLPVAAEADFCIAGTVDEERTLPEGPFGDHLGYYSLVHPFPVMNVERVYHRRGAIWPFTSVGRPPQEDTAFGTLIHELTGEIVPTVVPGVRAVHAVDAAGVHPLLLAIGSERYTPYLDGTGPQEILTQANAILGQGQMSLAKYLWIVDGSDDSEMKIEEVDRFLMHALRRVDWSRDLHFQTRTTIDTLDYSGTGLNAGSKVVIAAAGAARRELASEVPSGLALPEGFGDPRVAIHGVMAVESPTYEAPREGGEVDAGVRRFVEFFDGDTERARVLSGFPLLVLVDESAFAAATLRNFLWVAFTRSNPAADVHGIGAFVEEKHWGCRGPVVIDARKKPHHAPPLVDDPTVMRRVEELAVRGKPLHGIL